MAVLSSAGGLKWNWYSFSQLDVDQLYRLLRLREQVFMLEQQSLYEELDNQDQRAQHLLVTDQGVLIGYLRLLEVDEGVVKLGRIVLSPEYRGRGLGETLIQVGIEKAKMIPNGVKIKISAQLELQYFYAKLGFDACSRPYDDGGILHIDMAMPLD